MLPLSQRYPVPDHRVQLGLQVPQPQGASAQSTSPTLWYPVPGCKAILWGTEGH